MLKNRADRHDNSFFAGLLNTIAS